MCTVEKATKNFKLEGRCTKKTRIPKIERKIDNKYARFSQFTLVHPNDVCYGSYYYELYLMDEKRLKDFLIGK